MKLKMTLLILLIILIVVPLAIKIYIWVNPVFGSKSKGEYLKRIENSPNFKDGIFQNPEPTVMMAKNGSMFKTFRKFMNGVENGRPELPIETVAFDKNKFIASDSGIVYTWFGHSTLLININGKIILVDPVFSKAASPVSFINKAFDYSNAYSANDMPDPDIVIITHDHYDHLDYKTIKSLKDRTKKFFVPLGVEAHLLRWGVSSKKIEVADWGDSFLECSMQLTSVPARHFSGRGPRDRNKTLWCSWIVQTANHKIFLNGDSGYGNHFKEIGNKYGPFDLTFIECGQYNEQWPYIHSMPEQTVQAHKDLNGKYMVPIHWGKFRLSLHSWTEPIERVTEAAAKENVLLMNPKIGEIVILN
jgi:L-ascorbate metabolism protein UlaG (beta-lactamase superfamily)